MSAPTSTYEIRVQGDLDPAWSERMRGMRIEQVEPGPPPVPRLTGELPDQSALHGILNTLLQLHLPILSTERLPRVVPNKEE